MWQLQFYSISHAGCSSGWGCSDYHEKGITPSRARSIIYGHYGENNQSVVMRKYRLVNLDTNVTLFYPFVENPIESPMPTNMTPDPTTTPVVPVAAPTTPMMATVGITRSKVNNALQLVINAKPLHDLLDTLGATVGRDGTYNNRPPAQDTVLRNSELSTEVFLRREYPTTINLGPVFQSPPTMNRLKDLCNSAYPVIRKILTHYQPVDIQVTINKKVIG